MILFAHAAYIMDKSFALDKTMENENDDLQ